MKNVVVFPKMCVTSLSCVKFYNEEGLELSFAADDSCGAYKERNGRMYVAVFDGSRVDDVVEPERPFYGEADEFLQLLAKHLGYEVTKKA